jgi:NADH-quinone oxidoreductase subunit M
MVNHGISTGALFLVAMALIDRSGSREMQHFGGFGGRYPILYGVFLVALFSSVGLPGLNGFVGEFLTLVGAYRSAPAFAVVAVLGVVLAAVVLLWMFRLTMQGPAHGGATPSGQPARDLTAVETTVLAPLLILIVVLGLLPNILLSQMEAAATHLVTTVQNARQVAAAELPGLAWLTPKE